MPTNAAATGFWTAQNRNNARQGRALIQAIYQNNDTTPLNGTRSGVVPTTWDVANLRFTDLAVTVTSGLTMSVAPGTAVAFRTGQGPYEGWLTSAASVTCDAAPGSNPRNDIVVMRWYDSAQGDTSPDGNPCRIEIITGTPGAVPVDPITVNSLGVYTSFPTSGGGIGIPLARAQVSTGGVITLTRLRRSVGVIGSTRALMEGDSDTAGKVGDTRYNPTTDLYEVLKSDGTWQKLRYGVDIGGEWKDGRTTPALATGANKLQFATNVVSPNGLTFNGTDTWTCQTAGPYSFFGQLRSTAGVNGGICVGATTYSDATHIVPFLGFTNGTDYALSGTAYLTAGQQFCFYFYNNGSATTINNALRNAMAKVWKQQAAA
ncbi:hypothetical protein [Amycolatopsis sp. NPDC004625]|uniref:hypothetical protein n=1 Tax=Amycolatopsis sp. NPDC004625 TaxID=3154670 RepID=UPI0033ABEC98